MPPLPLLDRLSGLVDDVGDDARQREGVQEPGLVGVAPGSGVIRWPPVSVCHQVSTIGQRPPPTVSWYHIQASGLIGSPTVPRMRKLERSYFFGRSRADLDERADRGRRGVEHGHLVILDHFPEAARIRIGRYALEHDFGRADGQRTVADVGVPGDPAHVGRAPEDVARLVVERPLHREHGPQQVAAGGMLHALGLAGGAGGVEDEQRMLGVDPGRLAGIGLAA